MHQGDFHALLSACLSFYSSYFVEKSETNSGCSVFDRRMSRRVPCKFFARGTCLKGEHCEFSHDRKDPTNNICVYYQKGICSFGSRCRYNHDDISWSHLSASVLTQQSLSRSSGIGSGATAETPYLELSGLGSGLASSPCEQSWTSNFDHHNLLEESNSDELRRIQPEDLPICSFAAAGNCPLGNQCPRIHGDVCPTCGKQCLHPFKLEENEEHKRECEEMQKHLQALKLSQEIECSVCLERVLSKSTPAEQKFGLLTECDHPFCISCIRNWRSSTPVSGMDVNSTLRACPVCRKLSYFVVPSAVWYSSLEEKKEITDSYKAKLRSIDCKYFKLGNGRCPFGSSCFYKHDARAIRLEYRQRRSANGDSVDENNQRLSELLHDLLM